jgi:antirestriction protein ArdC
MPKTDIRSKITAKIVAGLEAGKRPWVRPWSADPNCGSPKNVISQQPYRGINPLVLSLASEDRQFQSRWWDMADIAEQINKVYKQSDYVGSLVVEGPTGRPTEYHGMHVEPPQWWDAFWRRHCETTGQTHEQTIEMLRKLLGKNWQDASLEQAEQAVAQTGPGTTSE